MPFTLSFVGATIVKTVSKDDRDRRRYLDKLLYYCELKEVALLSYCLLSNHIHLLLETPQGNLSKMMQPSQTTYVVFQPAP